MLWSQIHVLGQRLTHSGVRLTHDHPPLLVAQLAVDTLLGTPSLGVYTCDG